MTPTTSALPERFWSKVQQTETCWNWTATRCRGGYGQFRLDGKIQRAHRVSYLHLVGEIPAGLELDHLCRNRACVNPDHLEPVTRRENTIRGAAGEVNARRELSRTHCKRGHAFDEQNTLWSKGRRYCRPCRAIREAAYKGAA